MMWHPFMEDIHVNYEHEDVYYDYMSENAKRVPKFIPLQKVYIVYKRFNKVIVRETIIESITLSIYWEYRTDASFKTYTDTSKNIFGGRSAATEYAEKLLKIDKIKYK